MKLVSFAFTCPVKQLKIYRIENFSFVKEINSFYLISQLEPDLQNHITALSQPNEIFFKSCKTFLRLLKVDCFFLRSAPKISRFCFSVWKKYWFFISYVFTCENQRLKFCFSKRLLTSLKLDLFKIKITCYYFFHSVSVFFIFGKHCS